MKRLSQRKSFYSPRGEPWRKGVCVHSKKLVPRLVDGAPIVAIGLQVDLGHRRKKRRRWEPWGGRGRAIAWWGWRVIRKRGFYRGEVFVGVVLRGAIMWHERAQCVDCELATRWKGVLNRVQRVQNLSWAHWTCLVFFSYLFICTVCKVISATMLCFNSRKRSGWRGGYEEQEEAVGKGEGRRYDVVI